jgi:hypothetical protein
MPPFQIITRDSSCSAPQQVTVSLTNNDCTDYDWYEDGVLAATVKADSTANYTSALVDYYVQICDASTSNCGSASYANWSSSASFTIPRASSCTTPLVIPTKTSSIPDPEVFLRSYFNELWQIRDYQYMWDHYLTPHFKAAVAPKGFDDYAKTWNRIQEIDIESVGISRHSDTWASAKVILTFHMQDGSIVADQTFNWDLTYNPDVTTWQFDIH